MREVVDRSVLLMYYHAQFHSIITYGIIAWGSSTDSVRLFKLQKRAVRYIVGVNGRTCCRNIFKDLNILTIPCVFIFHLLLLAKTELSNLPSLNNGHYYTRNQTLLEIPKHNLRLYEKSSRYLAIKAYNKLPPSFKTLKLNQYKKQIKDMLKDKCYYSFEEYISDNL